MKNSKRGIRIVFNSPVILGFVLICFLVTLLNEHTGGRSNQLLFVTYHSSFKDPLTYVRFFTHVFGHSGWDHFLGNMTYILLLGPMLEEKYSSKNILKVFLITALVTALINYIFFPGVGLCGASGIAFAFIVMTSLPDSAAETFRLLFCWLLQSLSDSRFMRELPCRIIFLTWHILWAESLVQSLDSNGINNKML